MSNGPPLATLCVVIALTCGPPLPDCRAAPAAIRHRGGSRPDSGKAERGVPTLKPTRLGDALGEDVPPDSAQAVAWFEGRGQASGRCNMGRLGWARVLVTILPRPWLVSQSGRPGNIRAQAILAACHGRGHTGPAHALVCCGRPPIRRRSATESGLYANGLGVSGPGSSTRPGGARL
jgi:hypothetical protein